MSIGREVILIRGVVSATLHRHDDHRFPHRVSRLSSLIGRPARCEPEDCMTTLPKCNSAALKRMEREPIDVMKANHA
jgi:hypothetical protein